MFCLVRFLYYFECSIEERVSRYWLNEAKTCYRLSRIWSYALKNSTNIILVVWWIYRVHLPAEFIHPGGGCWVPPPPRNRSPLSPPSSTPDPQAPFPSLLHPGSSPLCPPSSTPDLQPSLPLPPPPRICSPLCPPSSTPDPQAPFPSLLHPGSAALLPFYVTNIGEQNGGYLHNL